MNINNVNAFLNSKNLKELVEFNRKLYEKDKSNLELKKSAWDKIEFGSGDKNKVKAQLEEYMNPKQEKMKVLDTSQIDEKLKKIKVSNILDKIARGEPVTKEERALAGSEAVQKAEFINNERKIFARQLKNCRTKEEAQNLHFNQIMGMAYGMTKAARKSQSQEDREMAQRYVRVMLDEWTKFSTKDYHSL